MIHTAPSRAPPRTRSRRRSCSSASSVPSPIRGQYNGEMAKKRIANTFDSQLVRDSSPRRDQWITDLEFERCIPVCTLLCGDICALTCLGSFRTWYDDTSVHNDPSLAAQNPPQMGLAPQLPYDASYVFESSNIPFQQSWGPEDWQLN